MGKKRDEWLTEAAVRKLAKRGKTDAEIGEALGAKRCAVKAMRLRYGIPVNTPAPRYKCDAKKVAQLNAKGLTDRQIGDKLGVKARLVRRTRQRCGIPCVRANREPRDFGLMRLRELVRRKLTDRQIGDILGRSAHSVRHFRLRNGIKKRTRKK